MNDNTNDFFAPPAFKPADAMVQLKRQLRDQKGLAERGNTFELRGQQVVMLDSTPTTIEAQLAKRPALTPEWHKHTLKNSADVRKFIDNVKAQLARWSDK